ncbi:hypothetical protein ACE7GA_01875 [Roseomonas sp. CCTCC AB2023176]|uniref:hypothetical protein n=1 Tax=Roseomonas sp. CCTCC AB2023176 TaxID=3342640 RepID=UPI0035D9DAA3
MSLPRALAAALLLASLAACATAPGGQPTPAQTVTALPRQIVGFQSTGRIIDLEGTPGGAGLGASHNYVPATGERMLATVYVYDRGRAARRRAAPAPTWPTSSGAPSPRCNC